MTVQLKSADSHAHPLLDGQRAYLHQPAVVPRLVRAAQLDLQAGEPVAPHPVAQQHRVAVVRLAPVQLGRLDRIQSPDQVPRRQLVMARPQKVLGIGAGERHAAAGRRRQVAAQVVVQVAPVVGRVRRHPVQHAERVVQGQVERRRAHQRGEPRHARRRLPAAVDPLHQDRQTLLQERVPDLQRVPGEPRIAPVGRDQQAEVAHHVVPLLVGQLARPRPLHAQRRLAPPHRPAARCVLHLQRHAHAGHGGQRFGAELQRHPRRHRQQVHVRVDRLDVRVH